MENPGKVINKVEKINYTEKLILILDKISQQINSEAESHGIQDLVNTDCTISMPNYSSGRDAGIYKQSEVDRDIGDVRNMEIKFSGAEKEGVKRYYKDKNIMTTEGIIDAWKSSKVNNKNGQTEMTVTALLHKILGKFFLVVRSAAIDDYKHGIDNLILDKRTGEVICAFDEVHGGDEGDRLEKKNQRIKDAAKKGGVGAKYGIGLEQGRLIRTSMGKMPLFYLCLTSEDLLALMEAISLDSEEISSVEKRIFNDLVKSLRDQKEMLEQLDLDKSIKDKLDRFGNTIKRLEGMKLLLTHRD